MANLDPRWARALLAFALAAITPQAQATLRCGTSLVAQGDTLAAVEAKCGTPMAAQSEGPAFSTNGAVLKHAARITVWVYGLGGGGYHYLRFVNEQLVEIDLRRQAPDGPLIPW